MRGIFISYRRDDAEGQAGRLFDDLSAHFGLDAVFMDVAGIKKGLDFRRIIDEHVSSCGVLLVIIGKQWLSATDSQGRRRLDDANDFVRLETAAALSRDIPVVPVLVHGAVMPTAQELPDVLKELAFRNGTELTHARWDSDVKLLIEDLKPYFDLSAAGAPSTQPARDQTSVAASRSTPPGGERGSASRSPWIAAGAVVLVATGSTFGYHLWQGHRPAPDIPAVAVLQPSPVTEIRRPESTVAAPPAVAKLPVKDEAGKLESMPVQTDASRAAAAQAAAAQAAAAQAAAARAAAARAAAKKAAEEQRQREEAERSVQLAEEQRKRDEEARRIAQEQAEKNRIAAEQAEKNRIAAEQAAGAKIFAEIATTIIGNRRR